MPDDEQDFLGILRSLNTSGVRYVLIGGLAMIAHGSALVTVDIDISFARDHENINRLVIALKDRNPSLRDAPEGIPFFFDARMLRNVTNLTLVTDAGEIDLMAEPTGISSFEDLWNRSLIMELFGMSVHVASLDELIAMKVAACGDIVGLQMKASSTVTFSDFRGLRALAEATGDRFRRGIVVCTGNDVIPFGERLHALPVQALWSVKKTLNKPKG